MVVMKVETDIIASIAASLIGRAVILVIMYVSLTYNVCHSLTYNVGHSLTYNVCHSLTYNVCHSLTYNY
jgi:hypothetical protein